MIRRTPSRVALPAVLLLALSGLALSSGGQAAGDSQKGRGRQARGGRQAVVEAQPARADAPPGRAENRPQPAAPSAPAPQAAPAAGGRILGALPLAARPVENRPVASQPAGQPNRGYAPAPTAAGRPTIFPAARPASVGEVRSAPADDRGRANPYLLPRAGREEQQPAAVVDRPVVAQPLARNGGGWLGERARPTSDAAQVRAQPWRPEQERARDQDRVRGAEPARQPLLERRQDRTQDGGRAAAPAAGQGDRVVRVPEARFRGPEADRSVRVVPEHSRSRLEAQLRDRVREQNRAQQRPKAPPTRDTVGNAISTDFAVIYRDGPSRVSFSYTRVRRDFGEPTFVYAVAPRSRAQYWKGYWDGYADGRWAARHHWRGTRVVINLYYGYYWSDPFWFAFHYPGYHPAVYHYWGWSPGWVHPTRVYYAPTTYVYVPATPYRYYQTAVSVDDLGAQRALEDVRRAWFDSDISSLAYHLTDQVDIRVEFDGKYEYTTTTDDYYAMTVDAMATTHTVALDFDTPIWLSSHEIFVTGRHVFYDPSDARQVVHVSYRLRKLGAEWFIVGVGSSLDPIQHSHRDFRR